jgi:hypothetical protein
MSQATAKSYSINGNPRYRIDHEGRRSYYQPVKPEEDRRVPRYDQETLKRIKEREGDFTTYLLPAVLRHIRQALYWLQPADLADAEQDAAGIAWKNFRRFIFTNSDPLNVVGYLAKMVVKSVLRGVGAVGTLPHKDVLSRRAQRLHGFNVVSYREGDQE